MHARVVVAVEEDCLGRRDGLEARDDDSGRVDGRRDGPADVVELQVRGRDVAAAALGDVDVFVLDRFGGYLQFETRVFFISDFVKESLQPGRREKNDLLWRRKMLGRILGRRRRRRSLLGWGWRWRGRWRWRWRWRRRGLC